RPSLDAALLSLSVRYEKLDRVLADGYSSAQALAGERALAALAPGRDAVLIWSSGHLPGLAAALGKAGYQRNDLSWLPAGKLPGRIKRLASVPAEPSRPSPPPASPRPAAGPLPRARQPAQGQDSAPRRDPARAPAPRSRAVMNGRNYRMTGTMRAVLAA